MTLTTRAHSTFIRWAHHPPASNRHEIVLALAGASVMSGFGTLVGPDVRPASVISAVPHWVALLWFAILALGGIALLLSAAWSDRLDALLIEGPAYLMLGGGALLYASCLIAAGQGTSFVAATGYTFYALASLTRTTRIALYVRYIRQTASLTLVVP